MDFSRMISLAGSLFLIGFLSCRPVVLEIPPEQQVWDAALRGDWPKLRQQIEQDPALIRITGEHDETLLHLAAAKAEDPAILEYLIEKEKTMLSAKNRARETPLELALRWNPRPEIVRLLAEKNEGRNQPLLFAARYCTNPECVQILIDHGADPDAGTTLTPLHEAATRNPNPEIIRCLVENGANVNPFKNLKPVNGRRMPNSPLHRAARYNENAAVSKTLVELGADPEQHNGEQLTPFDYAFRYSRNPDVVRYFVERYESNKTGVILKPLCTAAEHSTSPEIVAMLAARVSDVNARWNSRTPLEYAVFHANTRDRLPIIKALLDAGAKGNKAVYELLEEYSLDSYADLIKSYD